EVDAPGLHEGGEVFGGFGPVRFHLAVGDLGGVDADEAHGDGDGLPSVVGGVDAERVAVRDPVHFVGALQLALDLEGGALRVAGGGREGGEVGGEDDEGLPHGWSFQAAAAMAWASSRSVLAACSNASRVP